MDDQERLLGPFGLMLDSPRIGTAVQAVGAALRFDPDLHPLLRELAILTVAVHHRSDFEWRAHEAAALAAGATPSQLQAVLDDVPVDGLDPSTATGLAFVRAVLAHGDVDDALFADTLGQLGRSTTSALVWLVGYYAMLATALQVLRPQ
ncbi:MAG: carboxymuconolactone decarboxylase family protein [Quadrisphaera sp.]